jgi:plastocyanin
VSPRPDRRAGGWLILWASALVLAGGVGAGLVRAGLVLAGASKPVTHTVTIDATSYQPAQLVVHAGDTIVWLNKDLFPHTVTAAGKAFDSDVLVNGRSWRLVAKTKGAFDYACVFHPIMKGRLTVE